MAEPFIERAGPRIALLDSQLGPVQAAGTDPVEQGTLVATMVGPAS
jgi:hypothetical protein